MVFGMYGGCQHANAHGAVSKPRVGRHRLLAGCAFAKEMIKACMCQVRRACAGGDVTPQVGADAAEECWIKMQETLKLRWQRVIWP